MLMYLLGDKADSILSSFGLNEEQSNSYDTVKQKFQDYFNVRHNVIYERAKFNLQKQEVGESVDDFLTSLHTLVEICNYGNLRDEMICDRTVVGILDKSLAERLQLDAALTLDGCIKLVRDTDVVQKQQKRLAAHTHDFAIAGIQNSSKARASPNNYNQVCNWCGVARHARKFCSALKATCFNCGKIGHFKKVCRSKSVKLVMMYGEEHDDSAENSDHTRFFLGSVKSTNENQPDQRSISLQVNDVPMVFRIDTGADVTVISEQAFNKLPNVSLRLTNETLSGPEKQQLRVRGKFNAKVTYNGLSSYQDIFVVKSLSQPLLGWPAIQALNLVHIVNNVGNGNVSK